MLRYLFVLLASSALALTLPACGGDDDDDGGGGGGGGGPSATQVQSYCETQCAKQDECGFLELTGMTQAECETQCVNSANDNSSSDCSVSQSEVDACISALDAMTCEMLMSGEFPEECDLCPESDGGTDAGTGGTDTGGMDTGGGGGGDGTCEELAACCPTLPEEAQEGCTLTVDTMNDMSCETVLSNYQTAQLCP